MISPEDRADPAGAGADPGLQRPPRAPTRLDPPLYRLALARRLQAVEIPAPADRDDPADWGEARRAGWQTVLVALAFGAALGLGWLVLVVLRPAPPRAHALVGETLLADRVVSVTRWVTTVSTTLALGGLVVRLFVARSTAGDGPGPRMLRRAAVIGVVATTTSVVPRSVAVSDSGFVAVGDPGALGHVLQSRFGAAALLHVVGLALLLVVALPALAAQRVRREQAACVVGGALVLASYVLTGHARATSPAGPLVLAHAVHLVVVSTWFGGVAFLAVELREVRRLGDAAPLAPVVRRFSHTAMATVMLAAVTGGVLAASQLDSLGALVATPYGRALLAKLGALSLPLALGGYNARRLVPAIAQDEERAWARLARTLAAEALLIALGALLLTTAMTTGGL